eukprot:364743-Chlamydomonas_euryale.AAC.27
MHSPAPDGTRCLGAPPQEGDVACLLAFKRPAWKTACFHLLGICSLGIVYLVAFWSHMFKLRLTHTNCGLADADAVFVEVRSNARGRPRRHCGCAAVAQPHAASSSPGKAAPDCSVSPSLQRFFVGGCEGACACPCMLAGVNGVWVGCMWRASMHVGNTVATHTNKPARHGSAEIMPS